MPPELVQRLVRRACRFVRSGHDEHRTPAKLESRYETVSSEIAEQLLRGFFEGEDDELRLELFEFRVEEGAAVLVLLCANLRSPLSRTLHDVCESHASRERLVVLPAASTSWDDPGVMQSREGLLAQRSLVVVPGAHARRCRIDANANGAQLWLKQVLKGFDLSAHPLLDHSVMRFCHEPTVGPIAQTCSSREAAVGTDEAALPELVALSGGRASADRGVPPGRG